MRRRRLARADPEVRAALVRLLGELRYELIPLKNTLDQASFLPDGATVTVTASPAKGMMATVEMSLALAERGFDVIPHLSARMIPDRGELERLLGHIAAAGLYRVFVVGGDADDPGEFFDGLSLIQAIEAMDTPIRSWGVPAYPEGHPTIDDDSLQRALEDKQGSSSWMATQMCFRADTIVTWLSEQRRRGVGLEAWIGVAGATDLRKLVTIAARIGVGDSRRFAGRHRGLARKLVLPGGYSPDALMLGLGDALLDPVDGVAGFHVYTFNQVETTERWRLAVLEQLRA